MRIASILPAAALLLPSTVSAQTGTVVMAALGDSISAGFNACGWYASCASRSWSTGDSAEVNSHYLRLRALVPGIDGHNVNLAVPGSTSADLAGQAREAVAKGADYVTVMIGAQDACAASEKAMTPVAVFGQRVDEALAVLRTTGARVFVGSIPDLRRLWSLGRTSTLARAFWTVGHICPSMLAEPASTARQDLLRRARVRARVMAYNARLEEACLAYGPACRYDGGAVFSFPYALKHVSAWDYFHPSGEGQRALAKVTFDAASLGDMTAQHGPEMLQ
ncbi:SGNH/GDSL hydrolase family protein [Microtetraspora sp. NBRC 16547]|uniref:SGNH/GDSL hydrolase family protein n=1 Tax=Microtetraspora sp. NBRC 16547 TaxID=3030993 RepID=UPI0024A241D1|nr:SGNH/GDSL hydrolase family protein [Microtetraspora sp. NBRC 16547]GLX01856.1 lipoprotein [Microtetraspora sp. NBRC 16547]